MENSKVVISHFIRYNLMLRPETLKRLTSLELGSDQLDKLCSSLNSLNLPSNIIEPKHIEQVFKLKEEEEYGTSQGGGQDIIQILKKKLLNSIIIVDPFEQSQEETKLAEATDKIKMHLNRLEHIRGLLQKDPKYATSLNSKINEIAILSIGSVVGRTLLLHQSVNLLGLLVQLQNDQYQLSDGAIQVKLNMTKVQQINMYDINCSKGLINVGQIVIVSGAWEESDNSFLVTYISLPFSKAIKQLDNLQDLRIIIERDTFGSFKKTHNLLQQIASITDYSLNKQKALQYFSSSSEQQYTFWLVSEFSLTNMSTIRNFQSLLEQTEVARQDMLLPKAIFLIGQFVSSIKEMKENKLLAQDFCNLVTKYQDLLQNTLIFFMAAYNDPPLAYSLPHTPISLNLLLHNENLPANLHSLSNPIKVDLMGTKIQLAQTELSRELRKNHILQSEQNEIADVCETLWSQRNLGSFSNQQQVVYKWNYASSLQLSEQTELLVLADPTMSQFIHKGQISDVTTANPGNFSGKGEFLICTVENGNLSTVKCKI